MPVRYQIDKDRNLIRTVCLEPLVYDEVIGHFRELEADPNLPASLDVLLDLTGMRSLPDFGQMRSVAGAVERLLKTVKWGRCAVVAPADAVFGIARMFEVMTERYFQATTVFRQRSEAEMWLGLTVSEDTGSPAGSATRGQVITSYSRAFEKAPSSRAGGAVRFVRDDEKNPGWFFGDSEAVEGYFPTAWFQVDREAGRATALRDYNAMELSVEAGESVEVLESEAGWCLVRASGERIGWVPASCIEK